MLIKTDYEQHVSILACRDILNSDYISDPGLKLMIARHAALFEGCAEAKQE